MRPALNARVIESPSAAIEEGGAAAELAPHKVAATTAASANMRLIGARVLAHDELSVKSPL